MINTPETIWATDNYDWFTFDCNPDLPATQYIRTDIADARVKAAVEAGAEALRAMIGTHCNPLTDAARANLIAHLSYELTPVGDVPTWNQLAMEVVRLSNALKAIRSEVPE